ncbi:MAG: AraC family transcriptional regulator [Caulobacteraceae bacterium]
MTSASTIAPWPPSRANANAVSEDSCAADPAGPAAYWIYDEASVGFVTSGWFEYASEGASVLAAPGSVILGNAGEPFTVRHVDTLGNRRLVVSFRRDLLEEVARNADTEPRFGAIALPPSRSATRMFGLMRALSKSSSDDLLYPLAHAALIAERPRTFDGITPRDRHRVQATVKHIEAHFDEPCSLQTLADMAGLSRFHFVRVFAAAVGQSPNQYLINRRMRTAADRLLTTKAPIAQIAFDVGFNDISHFYACFREAFGCTPRQWRLRR